MSQPYIGEIRMFAGNYAPQGWMFCAGQLLPIAQYDALFNLIGTTYGGDGQQTFALPNLSSRVPVHMGTGAGGTYIQGQMAGEETVTLVANQLPQHTHTALANTTGSGTSPSGTVWAGTTDLSQFADPSTINGQLAAGAVAAVGGSQPHGNMIPYVAISFIIALEGIYPSQG